MVPLLKRHISQLSRTRSKYDVPLARNRCSAIRCQEANVRWHPQYPSFYSDIRVDRRYRNAWYSVSIDDGPKVYDDGYNPTDLPIQLMCSSDGLTEGQHTVVLINERNDHNQWNESIGGIPRICKSGHGRLDIRDRCWSSQLSISIS